MSNVDKINFVILLLVAQLLLVVIVHLLSGESLWRVRQNDGRALILVDLVCVCVLVLALAAFMPSIGRTGPAWRRPPFLVEFTLGLGAITLTALCAGFAVSAVRRIVRREVGGLDTRSRKRVA